MRISFAVWVLGSTLVVIGLTASAQGPPPKPVPATGLIAGKVIEAGSDRPVDEAIVSLIGAGGVVRRVMVDGQGRFVFAGLAAGRYGLRAEQFGYLRGEYGRLRPSGESLLPPVDLIDGQRITDANVLMWRLVSISGRVLDEAGEPVVGVSVRPLRRSVQLGQAVLTAFFDGYRALTTDDRGVYRAALLPPGDYAIAVPARVSTFPIDVMRDLPALGVSLGITETARLGDYRNLQMGSQVLTTTSSLPIPPARAGGPVTVYQTTFYPGSTSVEGASILSLSSGEIRTGVDVRLVATSTLRVSGRIVGPEGPLSLTTFKLLRADGAPVSDDFEVATGMTDARGQFTLLGVPPGAYVLRVRTSLLPGNVVGSKSRVVSAEQGIAVGEADVTDVEVTARWAATIAGHVEIRGRPLQPSALTLIVETVGPGPSTTLNLTPDKDFRFRVDVVPGRYLVWAVGADINCVSTSGGRIVSDDLLDVAGENIEDIAIVCGDPSTRISGVVRDDKGLPDSRARVLAFSADRRHWTGREYRPRHDVSARSTTTGTFEMSDLPPGDYFVVAIPETASVEWELPSVRDALIPSATRISLAAGSSRSVDLRTAVIK